MGVLFNKISRDELKPGDHIYSWRVAYLYAHHGIYVGDGKVIHFTRGAGQEIGTGTVLDNVIVSSSPSHGDNPCPDCGGQSNLDGVISSCLECFLSGGDLYIFEYGVSLVTFLAKLRGGTCTLAVSDPAEDVIHRAKILLQNGFGVYNVFKNNCEDFAIYCKTGLLVYAQKRLGGSGQANSLFAAASAVASSPLRYVATRFTGLGYLTMSFGGWAAVGVCYGTYCFERLYYDMGVRRDVKQVPVETLVAQPAAVVAEMTQGVKPDDKTC